MLKWHIILQNKFPNVNTIAKDSCFHFGYMNKADGSEDMKHDDGDMITKDVIEKVMIKRTNTSRKHFDFRLDGNINGQENGRQMILLMLIFVMN